MLNTAWCLRNKLEELVMAADSLWLSCQISVPLVHTRLACGSLLLHAVLGY